MKWDDVCASVICLICKTELMITTRSRGCLLIGLTSLWSDANYISGSAAVAGLIVEAMFMRDICLKYMIYLFFYFCL